MCSKYHNETVKHTRQKDLKFWNSKYKGSTHIKPTDFKGKARGKEQEKFCSKAH